MKCKWKKVMISAAAVMALTACGTQNEETTKAAAETTAAQTEAQTSAAETLSADTENRAAQEKPLVVYLNDFDAIIQDMFKEATGYDVEVVVGNGAETMSRIAAEKGNPQWDVVWIDSMYDVYNLAMEDELMTGLEPENAKNLTEFSQTLVPENKCMYPTGIHAAGVLVYRNDVYSEEEAPKTFEELTADKFAGQVGMADPGVAAPAYPLAAYFMDEMGMEGGQEYFSTMFANGLKVFPKNPQVVQALASGEISVAMLQESNAYGMIESGEPISII